jgi:hypothetical protein
MIAKVRFFISSSLRCDVLERGGESIDTEYQVDSLLTRDGGLSQIFSI